MSYILDALKNSDQDRKKNSVPNLHSQPRDFIPPSGSRRKVSPGAMFVGGTFLVCAVLLAWISVRIFTHPGGSASTLPAVSSPVNSDATDAPPTPGFREQQQRASETDDYLDDLKDVKLDIESSAEETAAVPVPEPRAVPEPASNAENPAPTPPAAPDEPGTEESPVRESDQPTSVARAVPAPRETVPVENRYEGIPHQRQLPFDVQRLLPDLNISVHLYSAAPSSRLVRINNKTYREGDLVDTRLTLEEITPDGVIMSIGDDRFWRYVR